MQYEKMRMQTRNKIKNDEKCKCWKKIENFDNNLH